jgi:energy-converting hydrogenase A subunit L
MYEIIYLIYLLVFIIGAILGLVISYKKHGEAFVYNKIEIIPLILAIIGWILLFNYGLFTIIPSFIIISISLFLIAIVLSMRPGYGRYETIIAILISIAIYSINLYIQ